MSISQYFSVKFLLPGGRGRGWLLLGQGEGKWWQRGPENSNLHTYTEKEGGGFTVVFPPKKGQSKACLRKREVKEISRDAQRHHDVVRKLGGKFSSQKL